MLLKWITALSAVLAVLHCMTIGLTALPMLWHFVFHFAAYFGVLALAAFVFFAVACALVDTSKPQGPDNPFYRQLMYLYSEAGITLSGIRLKTAGLEKTPKEGRFLLVCNHQNESDPPILTHCFKQCHPVFISKRENIDYPLLGKVMHKTGCQMINRENDREALKTILNCIQILKNDQASIFGFPEGGILGDYKLYHFRSGMLKIAQKANVPIVVCTLRGTADFFRNLKRLKPTPVELHLLDVIPAEELKGKTTVEIGDRIYEMMIADLGEEWRLPKE